MCTVSYRQSMVYDSSPSATIFLTISHLLQFSVSSFQNYRFRKLDAANDYCSSIPCGTLSLCWFVVGFTCQEEWNLYDACGC